jgi:hypothetical protein
VVEVARAAADAFLVVFQATAPLAGTIFPIIADTLGFIASNLQGAAIGALAAAGAFAGYSLSCVSASAATELFTAAITRLLSRTGIGVLVVVLGAAAGALANYALAGDTGAAEVSAAVQKNQEDFKKVEEAINKGTAAAKNFASEAQLAFKLPAEITDATLIQGTVDDATSAFKKFAQEAGSLAAVPKEVADAFDTLTTDIENMNAAAVDAGVGQQYIADSAQQLLAVIENITKARAEEKKATDAVADAARKASEEAGKRVQGLARAGLEDGERSQLTLSEDLLAITRTIADAEQALAAAREGTDSRAIAAAQERLALTRQTAAAATEAAKEQARQRELSALGLDQGLLKPVQTVTDQFKKVREAFDRGLIDGGEARTALQNLAAEGITIRKEIAAELARPSTQALQASDVRTQGGASEFLRLATGRADPAIEQRTQQLSKLEEIRRAIAATGANPVEILGA